MRSPSERRGLARVTKLMHLRARGGWCYASATKVHSCWILWKRRSRVRLPSGSSCHALIGCASTAAQLGLLAPPLCGGNDTPSKVQAHRSATEVNSSYAAGSPHSHVRRAGPSACCDRRVLAPDNRHTHQPRKTDTYNPDRVAIAQLAHLCMRLNDPVRCCMSKPPSPARPLLPSPPPLTLGPDRVRCGAALRLTARRATPPRLPDPRVRSDIIVEYDVRELPPTLRVWRIDRADDATECA